MRKLWADYRDLVLTPQFAFITRHWILYSIVSMIFAVGVFCIIFPDQVDDTLNKIKCKVKSIFKS